MASPRTPAELPIEVPRRVTWLRTLFHRNRAETRCAAAPAPAAGRAAAAAAPPSVVLAAVTAEAASFAKAVAWAPMA
jgi:hypothetical protein